jgi:hypothetical protein
MKNCSNVLVLRHLGEESRRRRRNREEEGIVLRKSYCEEKDLYTRNTDYETMHCERIREAAGRF